MAVTLEQVVGGLSLITQLKSFPLFCGYLAMVFLARYWKKIASPMNLRSVMVVYNFTASATNAYTAYGFFSILLETDSIFTPKHYEPIRHYLRTYWYIKIFELLDTVFMILRHKQRQISFLHVYHHGSMLLLTDLGQQYYPYIPFAVYLLLNSLVHVALYLYYGLSALYPENPPQWKRLMTQIQILQFVIDMIHAFIGYLYHGYCIYSLFYGFGMIFLFSNFYYVAYVKKRGTKTIRNGFNDAPKQNGACVQNGEDTKSSNGHTEINGYSTHSNGYSSDKRNALNRESAKT